VGNDNERKGRTEMSETSVARYSITVEAHMRGPVSEAWDILVNPAKIGTLFWGSTVESDFKVGSPIVFRGMWEGKPFEDRGTIKRKEENALLQFTHWSPTSGTPDDEANRHILTFRLTKENGGMRVTLLHENIPTIAMKDHSETMWRQLLERMKTTIEAD
jgi:uncharacterized protein YndB with AHSA1/START domain